MSDEQLPPIEHHIEVEVGIERAWEVLTAPECIAQWLGCLNYAAEPGHVLPAFAAVATSGSGG